MEISNELLDKFWKFFKENDEKGIIPLNTGIEDFCKKVGVDYGMELSDIEDVFTSKGILREPEKNKGSFFKGDNFRTFTGFVKESENKTEAENIERVIARWNYDTRKMPLYLTMLGLIITFGFSVRTCINEESNKSQIESLKIEIKSIKDSISIYTHTKMAH